MSDHPAGLRPLSAHARAELRDIATAPVPACSVNPGVIRRLSVQGLVELVDLPSPFPTHKGRNIQHLQVTAAGRKTLDDLAREGIR